MKNSPLIPIKTRHTSLKRQTHSVGPINSASRRNEPKALKLLARRTTNLTISKPRAYQDPAKITTRRFIWHRRDLERTWAASVENQPKTPNARRIKPAPCGHFDSRVQLDGLRSTRSVGWHDGNRVNRSRSRKPRFFSRPPNHISYMKLAQTPPVGLRAIRHFVMLFQSRRNVFTPDVPPRTHRECAHR